MPVRKIPKNYRNVTGIAAHGKANGPAAYESTLERDFITLLEFSPEVEAFEVQPVTLEWRDESNSQRRYTPDTLVMFDRMGATKRPWLCEVKYREDLAANWEALRPKFKAAVRFAKVQGWRFRIVTEQEIRVPKLVNARFLLRYRDTIPDANLMQLLDERLQELRETTPGALIQAIHRDEWNQARLLPALWYMVATFQVGTDLHQPLNMNSPIWWKS